MTIDVNDELLRRAKQVGGTTEVEGRTFTVPRGRQRQAERPIHRTVVTTRARARVRCGAGLGWRGRPPAAIRAPSAAARPWWSRPIDELAGFAFLHPQALDRARGVEPIAPG